MINSRSVLGIVPARGGSKGLRDKNMLLLGGKPLISWTIEAALRSSYLDRLILSSDDERIMALAGSLGCEVPFKRAPELATDEATGSDVARDALLRCPGYDYFVLLQPTSPLRSAEDIDATVEQCVNRGAPACVSVRGVEESPQWMFSVNDDQTLKPLTAAHLPTRRQELSDVVLLNGAVYAADTAWFVDNRTFIDPATIAYRMPLERSIDIDTEFDLMFAELLIKRLQRLA